MPISDVTNQLMRALPGALRPNPWSIDEYVMQAITNGWTIQQLAEASYMHSRNPNPAYVVTNIRNLSQYPPTATKPKGGWDFGHIKCDRHVDCEICRCTPGEAVHHKPVPMPDDVRVALREMVGRFGRVDF